MVEEIKRPALFLDRDGVIVDHVHYLHISENVRLIDGSADVIREMNKNNIPVIVVTNQSGIGRGLYTLTDFQSVQAQIDYLLAKQGAFINKSYYCPHHPQYGLGKYKKACKCRKPQPGMLLKAAEEFNLALEQSIMVGDTISDIEAGQAAGCNTILVRTGLGLQNEINLQMSRKINKCAVFDSLYHALLYVKKNIKI